MLGGQGDREFSAPKHHEGFASRCGSEVAGVASKSGQWNMFFAQRRRDQGVDLPSPPCVEGEVEAVEGSLA